MPLNSLNTLSKNSCLKTLQGRHPKQPPTEEECLALCLITLARSGTATTAKETLSKQKTDRSNNFYQCSICSKSFASHQALGGHKSSHSKPLSADNPSVSVITSATGRVHECHICHKSFPSGQALGGHMRRHYEGPIGGNNTNNNNNNSCESQSLIQSESRGDGGLGFDLNVLPQVECDEELENHERRKRQRLLEEEVNADHKV